MMLWLVTRVSFVFAKWFLGVVSRFNAVSWVF